MKAFDFNKIENTYFLIEEKTKERCIDNNIDYYEYISTFKTLIKNYTKTKNHIKVVENLDFKDFIKARAVLNKIDIMPKPLEIISAKSRFNEAKIKLFNYLEKLKEPYFFILNPMYFYSAGIEHNYYFTKRYGYKKELGTGSENIDIAIDYANYKLKL